jgi:hypothetical protein
MCGIEIGYITGEGKGQLKTQWGVSDFQEANKWWCNEF